LAPPLVEVPVPCAVAVPPLDAVVVPAGAPPDVVVAGGVVPVEAPVDVSGLVCVELPVEELDDDELPVV
jgi:hypothetical protein